MNGGGGFYDRIAPIATAASAFDEGNYVAAGRHADVNFAADGGYTQPATQLKSRAA
jgi:hypothetical protein